VLASLLTQFSGTCQSGKRQPMSKRDDARTEEEKEHIGPMGQKSVVADGPKKELTKLHQQVMSSISYHLFRKICFLYLQVM
jgi:hypothetical protein